MGETDIDRTVTRIFWDDRRLCSANALTLVKLLYPNADEVIACVDRTYDENRKKFGPGPRVDADILAARTGHGVEAVLSDDEDAIRPS